MPRLIKAVPAYRKHKASGQAFVEINGRRHYLGLWQSKASKLEYDRQITEWLSSGRSPSYGVPEHVTSIVELVVAYLELRQVLLWGRPAWRVCQHAARASPAT